MLAVTSNQGCRSSTDHLTTVKERHLKNDNLIMCVLEMSQTIGIDYHLFKSETKAGQLQ